MVINGVIRQHEYRVIMCYGGWSLRLGEPRDGGHGIDSAATVEGAIALAHEHDAAEGNEVVVVDARGGLVWRNGPARRLRAGRQRRRREQGVVPGDRDDAAWDALLAAVAAKAADAVA